MKKIFLLADDDSDDRSLFVEALDEIDSSIVCYCVADGKQVLNLLQSKDLELPQIIFLDINMPKMNGWQCLTELKKMQPLKYIPVIIFSTSAHSREAETALELGAFCFFTKPIDFIEFKEMLKIIWLNLDGDLLKAMNQFNDIKFKRVFNVEPNEAK